MAEVKLNIVVVENNTLKILENFNATLKKINSTMETLNRTGQSLAGTIAQAVESMNEKIIVLSASMDKLARKMDVSNLLQKVLAIFGFMQVILTGLQVWGTLTKIITHVATGIGRLITRLRNLGKASSALSGLGPKLRSFFSAFKIPAGAASRIKDLFSVIGNFASSVLGRLAGAARSIGAFFASFRLPAGLVTRMRGLFTLVGGFFRLLLPRLAFLARFLGPVGLAVSAFFAGWKIGKLVAELEVGGMKIKYWVEGIFIFWSEMFAKIPIHAKKMWLELKLKFHEGINSLLGFADKLPEKLKKMLGIEGALIEQTA